MLRITRLSFFAVLLGAASCKKEEPKVILTPAPDYLRLAPGNYWIYKGYHITPQGETDEQQYDSVYVEKDTAINGKLYSKLVKPGYKFGGEVLYLRDSSHYVVTHLGGIYFSARDFTSVFSTSFVLAIDTVAKVSRQMTDKDLMVTTPAGVFTTSSLTTSYEFFPGWQQHGVVRRQHARFADGVGMVTETLPFFQAIPDTWERRLVRYKAE